VRPLERAKGEANATYRRFFRELITLLEAAGAGDLRLGPGLWQVASGKMFGVAELLGRAGVEFAAMRGPGDLPVVEMTGEIYVRAVSFSNDSLIEKLEARGLQVHLAPQTEWLSYCGYCRRKRENRNRLTDSFSDFLQHRIERVSFGAIATALGWAPPAEVPEVLETAAPYVSSALEGEAVLTIGASLAAWRRRQIDAVVNVGPLECMPTKIAEAQFHHAAEREGLLSLTLAFNGDPVSTAALDNFAFEVKARFHQKRQSHPGNIEPRRKPEPRDAAALNPALTPS
jgi:hypothetical protein